MNSYQFLSNNRRNILLMLVCFFPPNKLQLPSSSIKELNEENNLLPSSISLSLSTSLQIYQAEKKRKSKRLSQPVKPYHIPDTQHHHTHRIHNTQQ